MTTFQSWSEVGQWYAGLERDRVTPDEKIRAKAAELIRGRNTDKEKIQALYEFVAKSFRYVSLSLGQGRYQPHAAAEVLANQYGDCKEQTHAVVVNANRVRTKSLPSLDELAP